MTIFNKTKYIPNEAIRKLFLKHCKDNCQKAILRQILNNHDQNLKCVQVRLGTGESIERVVRGKDKVLEKLKTCKKHFSFSVIGGLECNSHNNFHYHLMFFVSGDIETFVEKIVGYAQNQFNNFDEVSQCIRVSNPKQELENDPTKRDRARKYRFIQNIHETHIDLNEKTLVAVWWWGVYCVKGDEYYASKPEKFNQIAWLKNPEYKEFVRQRFIASREIRELVFVLDGKKIK